MYPPKVTDEQVQDLIRELSSDGSLPSGAAIRDALARRYHCRGGVSRIYRLLARERSRLGSSSVSAIGARLLEVENQNLREHLQQGREREDAQQAHWNGLVTQLLERFRAIALLVDQAAKDGAVTDALRNEVQGAETRAGQIEVLIRAFGPAAYRARAGD